MNRPDFADLAQSAIHALVKTDSKGWPRLCQYGLFQPAFFSAIRNRYLQENPSVQEPLGNRQIADYIVDAGYRVLATEREMDQGNFPYHAAAMLLSFPQICEYSNSTTDDEHNWYAIEESHDLASYWKNYFPDLESITIGNMLQTRLLQRKSGAPKTYSSFVSSFHATQFRRVAALTLISPEEVEQRIGTSLPGFDVRWGDSIRARTELPLFISLIASFYQAVSDALDFERSFASLENSTSAVSAIPTEGVITESETRLGVILRYAFLLMLAAAPTFVDILAGTHTFLQLAFGSIHVNVTGALVAASLIGYAKRTVVGSDIPYDKLLTRILLGTGGVAFVSAVFWATQENLKWEITSYLATLINIIAIATFLFIIILNTSILMVFGVLQVRKRLTVGGDYCAVTYPTLLITCLIMYSLSYIIPPVILPNAGINYSPSAGIWLIFIASVVPIIVMASIMILNLLLTDKLILPASRIILFSHIAFGVLAIIIGRFTPQEPGSLVVLVAAILYFVAIFAPLALAKWKMQYEPSPDGINS
jgi:hypothetical protein